MKKLLICLGISFALILSGCSCAKSSGEVDEVKASEVTEASEDAKAATASDTEEEADSNAAEDTSVRIISDIAYGSGSEAQKLDLYLPEGEGPFPLVFFMHGGAWMSGDKQDGQELGFIELTKYGYAVASVNYRLVGEADFPVGLSDCKSALRYLKANSDIYNIDPDHVAAAGDSSGGHYALMMALTPDNEDFEFDTSIYPDISTVVQACIAWYPVTDIKTLPEDLYDGSYDGTYTETFWSALTPYLGNLMNVLDEDYMEWASPVNYLNIDMPPILIQHGNADMICRISQAEEMVQAAQSLGLEDKVTLDIFEACGHRDPRFETEENIAYMAEFLETCFI